MHAHTRTYPGEGDAPQVWSEGLDRVWEKFVPRGGERAAELRHSRGAEASPVACGERRGRGVRSGPPGAGGDSLSRSPSLSWLLLSPREVLGSRRAGSRCCRLRWWRPSGALAARGGRGVHRPARAPIAQAAAAAQLLPSARARSSDKFWGTPRRLFFNCPTATHLPPAGWRLAPPSPPPLASPPPSSPPHPHPEARTRHREEPGLGAPGRSPFPSPSLAGRGAAARGAAAGNPRQGSLEAAPRRRSRHHRRGARGKRTERPREIQRPSKGPRGSSLSSAARQLPRAAPFPTMRREGEKKFRTLTPAPQIKALEPSGRRGTSVFPREFGVHSFLTLVKVPHVRRAKRNCVQGNLSVRLFRVRRKGSENRKDGQIALSSQICSLNVCVSCLHVFNNVPVIILILSFLKNK